MGRIKTQEQTFFQASVNAKEVVERYFDKYPSKKELKQRFGAEFDHFTSVLPGLICVYNFAEEKYEYIGKAIKKFTGIDREKVMEGGVEGLLRLFPEYDKEIFITEIYPVIYKMLELTAHEKRADKLRFSYQIRFRNLEGKNTWLSHDFTILEVADNGFPLTFSKYLHDIHDVKKDNFIRLKFEIVDGDETEVIYKKDFAIPDESLDLTKREVEILSLISQGYKNAQIANELHISEETVKTHRKNMLSKNETKNSGELIRTAFQNGVLQ